MKDEFVDALAGLLVGLQAPGSMGMLGAGREPWVQLRRVLNLSGWHNEAEAHEAIRRVFQPPRAQ